MTGPGWPDTRGWLVGAFVALTVFVLALLAVEPELASIQLFVLLAQAIVISGLIGIVGYFFGASQPPKPPGAAPNPQNPPNPNPQ